MRIKVLGAGLALVVAACGGGESSPTTSPSTTSAPTPPPVLSAEEYFDEVAEASAEFVARGDAVEFDLGGAANPVAEAKRGFPAIAGIVEDFVGALAGLSPPAELGELHADTVAAGDDAVSAARALAAAAQRMESLSDLQALVAGAEFTEFDRAMEEFSDTCVALQSAADERSIDIDLRCDG